MKKAAAVLLIFAILMSFAACGGKGKKYTLVSVPDQLHLDVESLSEDVNNLMPFSDRTPLIAAIPGEDLYVYCTDTTIVAGVLVKYDGRIQYFPWRFTPQIADPQVCIGDYNADGVPDIAFTYCDTANEIAHNENLHILLSEEGQFRDLVYAWKTVATDATIGLTLDVLGDNRFKISLEGKSQEFTMPSDGYGKFMGIVSDRFQDFTLGDTITVQVKPGFVFENRQMPVYEEAVCTGKIVIQDDVLRLDDLKVTLR